MPRMVNLAGQGRGMPTAFPINQASLDIPLLQFHRQGHKLLHKDMGVILEQS